MSNWICDKCGATYIDVSHQEPSVLKQEIEIRKLKELLGKCRDVLNMAGYVFAKIKDVEKAKNLLTKIDEVLK